MHALAGSELEALARGLSPALLAGPAIRTLRQIVTDRAEMDLGVHMQPGTIYVDQDGATQVLAADQYLVDAKSQPARIEPAYSLSWPATRTQKPSARYICTCQPRRRPKSSSTCQNNVHPKSP